MDYKKIIEEQIEILQEKQNGLKKKCLVDDLCQVAKTIVELTEKASVFPSVKKGASINEL